MKKILIFLSIVLLTACNREGIIRETPEFETYTLVKAKCSPVLKKEGMYAYIKEYDGKAELRFRIQHRYTNNNWNDVYLDQVKYLFDDKKLVSIALDKKQNDYLYFGVFQMVEWNDVIADEELLKEIIKAKTIKIKYRRENPDSKDERIITKREQKNIELIYNYYKENYINGEIRHTNADTKN